ncbi:hypothetical protein DN745_03215 [Bradymonas sediminis]|uniref:Uncharacterized protein n=1 Tax=Bradymonas sediminis TaxID=1548548 RepID=A0A2Z4FHE2_9DELT|nr:hypothetical protein DN745_03215 [Bradymonas sediminis]
MALLTLISFEFTPLTEAANLKPRHITTPQNLPERSPKRRLLAALRAKTLVPTLIHCLSRGRSKARKDDPRILRDWVESIVTDPGWQVIGPRVEALAEDPKKSGTRLAADWLQLWSKAVAAGWSPRTDHHHALLFGRFCDEAVAAKDFESAEYFWTESVAAWLRVLSSDYLDAWLKGMGATKAQTREQLLEPIIAARAAQLRSGLSLENAANPTAVDLQKTRFAWQALTHLAAQIKASGSEEPALIGLGDAVARDLGDTQAALLRQFARMIDALDLSAPNIDALLAPFNWADAIFEILPIDASVAARVSDAAVDIGWKLRKLGPDELDKWMKRLLSAARPFNDALEAFILDGQAFGQNSTCADFLVFRGEHRSRSKGRDAFFERAIKVCPGHRNASMMLSYEKLLNLSDLLLRVRMVPSAITMLPGTATRVETAIAEAWELLEQAESLYPSNDKIDEYRQQLAHEAKRLGTEKTR